MTPIDLLVIALMNFSRELENLHIFYDKSMECKCTMLMRWYGCVDIDASMKSRQAFKLDRLPLCVPHVFA